IGSGFSSLAASCYLAADGFDVSIYEKNNSVGGRASVFSKDGFKFDMGPTWYWMPDVFEHFFNDFNTRSSDFYQLDKLNPAYKVIFTKHDSIIISDTIDKIYSIFEKFEPGSSKHLHAFLESAKYNYEVAIKDLVYRPGNSIVELITPTTIRRVDQFFQTISKQVRNKIKHPYLISILEFPVLFLGAKPSNTPSFYNFMNYADFGLGTWHPKGGMYEVINAMVSLATSLGVKIYTNQNVSEITVENKKVSGIIVNGDFVETDIVLSGADYHHTETLLEKPYRQYSENYWNSKTFAPSSLLFYVAFDKKLHNVNHHTLFFDADFNEHAATIYDNPSWPKKPLFYASFPSITDASFAPKGKEAGTFLIPLAPGIEDTTSIRERYFEQIIGRFEALTGQEVKDSILFKRSYCINDFINDYNSYKGNAYGLANILTQTAFLRPKIKSKKVDNLYFTGQLTVPGPGVPPSLISGKIVSLEINKKFKILKNHETIV
ncbi:MAG: phytoene desaturase, partial [Flavobacteriaceae bacterium]|nr:phytoene desaturase [Flavobacteriaceae bacterium]